MLNDDSHGAVIAIAIAIAAAIEIAIVIATALRLLNDDSQAIFVPIVTPIDQSLSKLIAISYDQLQLTGDKEGSQAIFVPVHQSPRFFVSRVVGFHLAPHVEELDHILRAFRV